MIIPTQLFKNQIIQLETLIEFVERMSGVKVANKSRAQWLRAYNHDPERTTDLLSDAYTEALVSFVDLFPERSFIKGDPGRPGKNGKTPKVPTKREILAAIKREVAMIPPPKNGKDGEDGIDGQDGIDGTDAEITDEDLEAVSQAVYAALSDEIPEAVQQNPEAIRNSLELLQGDERLEGSAIKDWDEILKKLDDTTRIAGAGTSRNIVASMIATAIAAIPSEVWVMDATPTGDVNGSNLVFTIPVSASQVVVYADGMRVRGSGNDYNHTTNSGIITFISGRQPFGSISIDYLPT